MNSTYCKKLVLEQMNFIEKTIHKFKIQYRTLSFVLILILMLVFLPACGGGGGGGNTKSTPTTLPSGPSSTTVTDLTGKSSFTIPSNAISFLLSTDQSKGPREIDSLTNPSGDDVLSANPLDDLFDYSNILIPTVPPEVVSTHLPTAGTWRYITTGPTSVKLTLRRGDPPTSSTLHIKPFLTGMTYSESAVNGALAVLKTIFEKVGLQIELDAVTVVSDNKFAAVSTDFNDATTAELVSMGAADRVNLFFVEDLIGQGKSSLGISAGIPGSLGIEGSHNGVLNGMNAHTDQGTLNVQLLGETAAHEMGHWLGLYHTTERNGETFDLLTDTPECPLSKAANQGAGPQPSDCVDLDGKNLMFWQGDPNIDQITLSPQQIHVINYSPIAR